MSDSISNQKTDSADDQEMNLWEFFEVLIKNWKLIIIITTVVFAAGICAAVITNNEESFTFSHQVIYEEYEYYPVGIYDTYEPALEDYLLGVYGGADNINVKLEKDIDKNGYLDINYNGYTKEESNSITEDICNWHNTMLNNELNRRIEEKEDIVDLYYEDYVNKENDYYVFLNSDGGYYDTKTDVSKYRQYVNSYKSQLDNRNKILTKVENDFPLLLNEIFLSDGMPIEYYQREEIIENHYSEESLKKEIEFVEIELEKNKEKYLEASTLFEEMTVTNVTMSKERDVALGIWQSEYAELEELKLDLETIEEYYISECYLENNSSLSIVMSAAICLILGVMIAIGFVFIRNSYKTYKKQKNN